MKLAGRRILPGADSNRVRAETSPSSPRRLPTQKVDWILRFHWAVNFGLSIMAFQNKFHTRFSVVKHSNLQVWSWRHRICFAAPPRCHSPAQKTSVAPLPVTSLPSLKRDPWSGSELQALSVTQDCHFWSPGRVPFVSLTWELPSPTDIYREKGFLSFKAVEETTKKCFTDPCYKKKQKNPGVIKKYRQNLKTTGRKKCLQQMPQMVWNFNL